MSQLQFFIRHQSDFLQDKMILVFKSDEARQYFQHAIKGSKFEERSSESAEHAAAIDIKGKIIPYGYTVRLRKEERTELSTANWEETGRILAEGNERLYKERAETKEHE